MGQQGGGFGQQGYGLPRQTQYQGWPQQSQARQNVGPRIPPGMGMEGSLTPGFGPNIPIRPGYDIEGMPVKPGQERTGPDWFSGANGGGYQGPYGPQGNTGMPGGYGRGPVASSRGPWDMNRAAPPAPVVSGAPMSGGNFGPLPPGGAGSFNGTNYGRPGTELNPLGYGDFARQRVQQGVAGGGGYSTQDLSDAGMSQRDLTAMIEQHRNGTLAPVNLTQDQATAAQELARRRAYASPAFQGLLGAVRR